MNKKIVGMAIFGFSLFSLFTLFRARKAIALDFSERENLSADEIYELAKYISKKYFPKIDPLMIATIASIESSGNVKAYREDPKIKDASIGLMQVLQNTANWMYNLGNTEYDPQDLLDAETSVYFGSAYLEYNRNYNNTPRSEEFIVRSYNGGSGSLIPATQAYFNKYVQEKQRLKTILNIQ